MKILIADTFEDFGIDALRALGCEVTSDPSLTPETMGAAIASISPRVLIVRSTRVPAGVIHSAPSLKLIVRAGAGFDTIDGAAAASMGIGVCNCPGMNAVAVAELAMGHLIACDRNLKDQHIAMANGRWNKKGFAGARGLRGSTLGIVGLGAIGAEMAQRARAFDMNLIIWSRSITPETAKHLGASCAGNDRAALLRMLPQCDHVSIHVASAPETKGMCDAEFFAAMKPGSTFINTARGDVCDETALIVAIKARGVRAGLDVFANQPSAGEAEFTCEIASLPGCSVSHHNGASTEQAQRAVAEETVRIVKHFIDKGDYLHRVNEEWEQSLPL